MFASFVLADDYRGLLDGFQHRVTAKLYGDEGYPSCTHIRQGESLVIDKRCLCVCCMFDGLQLIITDSVQDCWFLAALCAVAKTGQGFMMSHIRRTKGEGDVCHGAKPTSDRLLTQLHWVRLRSAKVGVRRELKSKFGYGILRAASG
jgi:hypothetical protein